MEKLNGTQKPSVPAGSGNKDLKKKDKETVSISLNAETNPFKEKISLLGKNFASVHYKEQFIG
jgi:hypothetical protein